MAYLHGLHEESAKLVNQSHSFTNPEDWATYSEKEVWRSVCNGSNDRRTSLQGFHKHCPHDGVENKH